MPVDIKSLAAQITEAITNAPELAQELIDSPAQTVERITGQSEVDLTELFQLVLSNLSKVGIDLSGLDLTRLDLTAIDLSRLDLTAIDLSRLDLGELAGMAKSLGISFTSLAGAASGLFGGSGVSGLLGSLFGRK